MAVCPSCGTQQERRVNGRCPRCLAQVDIYKGHWVRTGKESPPEEIVRHFERRVSTRLSAGREVPVVFSIPRKGMRIKRERLAAERLLKQADYDIDLVLAALDILFYNQKFSWKSRDSLIYADIDFTSALAIARADREERLRMEEKNRAVYEAVMSNSLF